MNKAVDIDQGIPCTWMRGGTSKGGYFLASDLPADRAERDRVLLAVMGSPDPRQIDGMGGAHPLTSKIAIVSPSSDPDCDVDYLFLQVLPDKQTVSDTQNCGNILAGIGPFAIEHELVKIAGDTTDLCIRMVNSDDKAIATVVTAGGHVHYEGDTAIDGVPGTAAPVLLNFPDTAGSMCGALLPTGAVRDRVNDTDVTLIDNGMPVALLRASDFGLRGTEGVAELEANDGLRERLEALRLAVGPLMNLGDVAQKTVPKMTLLSPATGGGVISTRSFIPHRCHEAIGMFAAVTVATACRVPGTIAHEIAPVDDGGNQTLDVEHPTGRFSVNIDLHIDGSDIRIERSGFVRTARKLFEGRVFVPAERSP